MFPISSNFQVSPTSSLAMPFNNAEHSVATFNGAYNDVHGNQINTTTYSYSSKVHISSPATIAVATRTNYETLPSTVPTTGPYLPFIALIAEIQQYLCSIEFGAGESEYLKALSNELRDVTKTTALVGRLIEVLEAQYWQFRNMVWFRKISDWVQRWMRALRDIIGSIIRYRDALRDTKIGPFWKRIWMFVMNDLIGTSNIESVLRTAHVEMIKFKVPLVGLLKCFGSPGDGILQCPSAWISRNPEIRHLSTHIPSHFDIPRYRLPHAIVRTYDYKQRKHQFTRYHPYMTYKDVSRLIDTLVYGMPCGWVDQEDEKLLTPTKLRKMIKQRTAAQVSVEPVYRRRAIFTSNIHAICPSCHCGSQRSTSEWHACDSCNLRFQNVDKTSDRSCSVDWRSDDGRYVMVEQYDLSSITHFIGDSLSSAEVPRFFQHLSDMNAPMANLELYVKSAYSPECRIPKWLATESGPPMLQHLQDLRLYAYNGSFEIFEMILPQINAFLLDASNTLASPVIDVILTYRSLTKLTLTLDWDDPLDSIIRLLSRLPELMYLTAKNFPGIGASTLDQISEEVRSIRSQNHPIRKINLTLPRGTKIQPPEPWTGSRDLILEATQM